MIENFFLFVPCKLLIIGWEKDGRAVLGILIQPKEKKVNQVLIQPKKNQKKKTEKILIQLMGNKKYREIIKRKSSSNRQPADH